MSFLLISSLEFLNRNKENFSYKPILVYLKSILHILDIYLIYDDLKNSLVN